MESAGLSEIAIIIPALNEARTIAEVVTAVSAFGLPIVVDDGSTDGTADLARQCGADVVRHEHNRGYDAALGSGFARASALGCRYAITIDADGQHNPGLLADYIRLLRDGNDLVLGIRDRHQRVSESVFAWIAKRIWGVHDPLCGMKGYRMSVYEAQGYFDSCGSVGTELALRAIATGYRFAQWPVRTRDRLDASRFARRFAANRKILRALVHLLWRRLLGRMRIRPKAASA